MITIHKHYCRLFVEIILLSLLSLITSCASQEAQPGTVASVAGKKQSAAASIVSVEPSKKSAQGMSKPGADNPNNKIYLGADGMLAGTGAQDRPASEVYRIARSAHPQALSTPGLPKDKFGLIDWNLMVAKKIIQPADSLDGSKNNTPLFELDVLIKTKGDFTNNVLFNHKIHVYWLDCKNCHTGIFVMAKGKNNMSMQGIVKGQWCGRCHGKVSFPLTDCNRCHSRPKP